MIFATCITPCVYAISYFYYVLCACYFVPLLRPVCMLFTIHPELLAPFPKIEYEQYSLYRVTYEIT